MVFVFAQVNAQLSITSTGTPFTENFNGMGSSGTATLPTGFKIGTDWASGTTATTLAYGTTGTGAVTGTSAGGTINWANGVTASSTDRSLGFLTTGSFLGPRSIILAVTNNTGGTITSLDIAFDYEKSRTGTRAFDWTFFHGATSTAGTADVAGNQSYAADGANAPVNPPTTISKSFTLSGLSIANGTIYYLRWTYAGVGGSTNAQGLSVDNFSVTATGSGGGTPDIGLSSPNPAVPAGNIVPGTGANAIYMFDLTVAAFAANLTGVSVNTTGTYSAADVTGYRLYYSTDNILGVPDVQIATLPASGAGIKNFTGFNQALPIGVGYIFVAVDLACGAVVGNTIAVDAITTADITFTSANKSGTAFASAAQTVVAVVPNNITGEAATNGDQQSSVSWTNPLGCFNEIMIVAATAGNSGIPTGDGTAYTADLSYGAGTALGNGFVVYKGTASPQVVTNLTNGTTYYFKIFSRFGTSWSSGVEVTATPAAPVVTTYTWNTTNGAWGTASNWTPARTTPASSDILVFNPGGSFVVSGVPTQTIGKLSISNNTIITLNPTGTNTLTIAGGTGTDLDIEAGSSLLVDNGTGTALTINLGTGATGAIAGLLEFTDGAHRLTATDAGSITITGTASGSTGFSGNMFGTTSLNSVIFASGSAYAQTAGSNPFGATAPASVVTFQPGSVYRVLSSLTPSFAGRNYANIIFNAVGATWTLTGGTAVTMDNLSVHNGTVNFNMTGTPGHSIKGNIYVEAGTTLNFNPASAGTVNLNGTVQQMIEHDGTLSFSNNSTIVLNNAAGFIIDDDVAFTNLTMTLGKFDINAHNVSIAGTLTGGSTASYFVTSGVGTVSRTVGAPASVFPMGNAKYNPIIIENGSGHTWSAKVADGVTPDAGFTTDKAVLVTWDITPSVNPPAGGADITFQFDEATQVGASFNTGTTVQAWNRSTGNWLPSGSPAGVNTTVPNAATVKVTGLTTFSPYALANIDGPLPVQFGNVKAYQQGGGIKIDWTNLTESQVANYKVERSSDGQNFTALGTVNPLRNDGNRADYSFLDAAPLPGTNFYRIQSLEFDGKKLYSIVIRVNPKGGATDISLYPNPVTGNKFSMQATALPKGSYTIRVINAGGQQVYSQSLNHTSGGSITESVQLPATIKTGMYTLQLSGGPVNITKAFIIR